MRLAALADLHGNLAALEAVLADLTREGIGPAQVVVAGDMAMVGPQPAEVIARLRRLEAAGAILLGGNVDRWGAQYIPDDYDPPPGWPTFVVGAYRLAQRVLTPEDWEWQLALPPSHKIPGLAEQPAVLAVHGSPRSDTDGLSPEMSDDHLLALLADLDLDVGLLVCAHTHRPMVRRVGKYLVVNTGSVGRPLDGDPRASYALLSYHNGLWSARTRRVTYDVAATVAAAHRAALPESDWYAEALRSGAT